MFSYDHNIHGFKIEPVKNKDNITRSALASLRIAIRAYFNSYYVFNRYGVIPALYLDEENDPFAENTKIKLEQICNNTNYQEVYMQCIFHFHHFFELLLKDVLVTVHPKLNLKISLDGKNSIEILNFLNKKGDVTLPKEETVEFGLSLERIMSLENATDFDVPDVVSVIKNAKKTLMDLNTLRNRAWHRGKFILRINEFDLFISQCILPLVLKCIETTEYKELEKYWKYSGKAPVDPINEIIEAGKESNFKKISFFKAYGIASYQIPDFNIDSHENDEKAKAIVNALHDLELDTCFVCGSPTLIVSTETDADFDSDGEYIAAWWNTTAAECLTCRLSIFPDVGEPKEHGIWDKELWKSGDYKLEEEESDNSLAEHEADS